MDGDERRGFKFEVDQDYFERVVWPAVAHRSRVSKPPEAATEITALGQGFDEENELDGSPVIGCWNRLPNLYTVAGFSGHGMMHAPAARRAIAELVVHRGYRTIDLGRFGYERVKAGEPYREEGIL